MRWNVFAEAITCWVDIIDAWRCYWSIIAIFTVTRRHNFYALFAEDLYRPKWWPLQINMKNIDWYIRYSMEKEKTWGLEFWSSACIYRRLNSLLGYGCIDSDSKLIDTMKHSNQSSKGTRVYIVRLGVSYSRKVCVSRIFFGSDAYEAGSAQLLCALGRTKRSCRETNLVVDALVRL